MGIETKLRARFRVADFYHDGRECPVLETDPCIWLFHSTVREQGGIRAPVPQDLVREVTEYGSCELWLQEGLQFANNGVAELVQGVWAATDVPCIGGGVEVTGHAREEAFYFEKTGGR